MSDTILCVELPLLMIGTILIKLFIPRYEAFVVLPIMAIASPIFLIGVFKAYDERRRAKELKRKG